MQIYLLPISEKKCGAKTEPFWKMVRLWRMEPCLGKNIIENCSTPGTILAPPLELLSYQKSKTAPGVECHFENGSTFFKVALFKHPFTKWHHFSTTCGTIANFLPPKMAPPLEPKWLHGPRWRCFGHFLGKKQLRL